jgi:hypothetical protein
MDVEWGPQARPHSALSSLGSAVADSDVPPPRDPRLLPLFFSLVSCPGNSPGVVGPWGATLPSVSLQSSAWGGECMRGIGRGLWEVDAQWDRLA